MQQAGPGLRYNICMLSDPPEWLTTLQTIVDEQTTWSKQELGHYVRALDQELSDERKDIPDDLRQAAPDIERLLLQAQTLPGRNTCLFAKHLQEKWHFHLGQAYFDNEVSLENFSEESRGALWQEVVASRDPRDPLTDYEIQQCHLYNACWDTSLAFAIRNYHSHSNNVKILLDLAAIPPHTPGPQMALLAIDGINGHLDPIPQWKTIQDGYPAWFQRVRTTLELHEHLHQDRNPYMTSSIWRLLQWDAIRNTMAQKQDATPLPPLECSI